MAIVIVFIEARLIPAEDLQLSVVHIVECSSGHSRQLTDQDGTRLAYHIGSRRFSHAAIYCTRRPTSLTTKRTESHETADPSGNRPSAHRV